MKHGLHVSPYWVNVTAQAVRCCGKLDIRFLLATNGSREQMHEDQRS